MTPDGLFWWEKVFQKIIFIFSRTASQAIPVLSTGVAVSRNFGFGEHF